VGWARSSPSPHCNVSLGYIYCQVHSGRIPHPMLVDQIWCCHAGEYNAVSSTCVNAIHSSLVMVCRQRIPGMSLLRTAHKAACSQVAGVAAVAARSSGHDSLLGVEQVVVQCVLLPDNGLLLVGLGVGKASCQAGLAAKEATQVGALNTSTGGSSRGSDECSHQSRQSAGAAAERPFGACYVVNWVVAWLLGCCGA
jgi:hypothetical protein